MPLSVRIWQTFLIAIKHLNTELNPICHLLLLLEAHHILHVSRIRVKVYAASLQQTHFRKCVL